MQLTHSNNCIFYKDIIGEQKTAPYFFMVKTQNCFPNTLLPEQEMILNAPSEAGLARFANIQFLIITPY